MLYVYDGFVATVAVDGGLRGSGLMNAAFALLIAVLGDPGVNYVRGTVYGPEGAPVEGAQVLLTVPDRSVSEPGAIRTSADGRFLIEQPVLSSWMRHNSRRCWLVAHRPGVGTGAVEIDGANLPLHTVPIRLEICATITLRVVDPQDKPVRDAEVRIASFHQSAPALRTVPLVSAEYSVSRTNADGQATFECVPASAVECHVEIRTPAFGIQTIEYRLVGGQDPIRLRPVGRLTGRVVVDDPAMAGGKVWVRSMPGNPSRRSLNDLYHAVTIGMANFDVDAKGEFEVPALAVGSFAPSSVYYEPGPKSGFFQPGNGGFDPRRREPILTIEAGQVTRLEVPLERGIPVRGSVVEAETMRPIAGAIVDIGPHLQNEAIAVSTDDRGKYEALVLPATKRLYSRLHRAPSPFHSSGFDAFRDKESPPATGVDLAPIIVHRGIELTGTVVDEQGRAVPYAHVLGKLLYDTKRAQADVAGRFSIGPFLPDELFAGGRRNADPAPRGKIVVTAEVDERASVEGLFVDLSDPGARQPLRVTIEPAGLISISGRIVDDDGAPIAGAPVALRVSEIGPEGPERGSVERHFPGYPRPTTDADGRFALPHPVARLAGYRVTSKPADRIAVDVEVPAPDRASRSVVIPDIVSHGLRRIEGRVVDRQNRPLPRVAIWSFGPQWAGPIVRTVTDAEGKYGLEGLHSRSRLVFAGKEGFRSTGTGIPRGSEPATMTLVPLGDMPDPGQSRRTQLFSRERQRELLDAFERGFENLDQFDRERIMIASAAIDEAAARRALDLGSPSRRARAHARLGQFDEALAEASLIPDQRTRSMVLFEIAKEDPDAARRRRTIAQVAPLAGQLASVWSRFQLYGAVLRKVDSAGDKAAAIKLLEELLPKIDALMNAREIETARGAVAAGCAAFAPETALGLIASPLAEDSFRDHYGQIALGLAAVEPEQSEAVLMRLQERYGRDEAAIRVCHRMAIVDLPRADRIAAGIQHTRTRFLALGSIAHALHPKDPAEARLRLRKAFAEMDKLRVRGGQPELFPAAMILVHLAETIEPDAVEEFVWLAAAQHPGPPSSDGSAASWPEHQDWYSGMLAMLLALYDVEPAAARDLAQPLLQKVADPENPIHGTNGHIGLRASSAYAGIALTYPERTIASYRDSLSARQGENRRRSASPVDAMLHAFFDQPEAFWEYVQHEMFETWVIGSDDPPHW